MSGVLEIFSARNCCEWRQNLLSIVVLANDVHTLGPDSFFNQLFNFTVGARGYVDFIVWFHLSPFSFPGKRVRKVRRRPSATRRDYAALRVPVAAPPAAP